MKGFSPRNLKYMRALAMAWPEREIVQAVLAQSSWRQNIVLLEKLTQDVVSAVVALSLIGVMDS